MARSQEELKRMFNGFASGFTDEQLDNFIQDSERIMRRPAGLLLAQAGLDASTKTPFNLLDHACGTGPIAAHLYTTLDKQVLAQSKMLCADVSENLVHALRKRAYKHGWPNIETAILDAQNSGLPDTSFTHVTVNFGMHVIPDPGAVLQDTLRVLKPGGTFAFTVWHKDNQGWVPDMRSAFAALPFEAPMLNPLPMAVNGRGEFIDPALVSGELERHGFEDVKVETVEHVLHLEGAEDYLRSFGMMRYWMVGACWSEESKEKAKGMLDDHIVKHLTEKHGGKGWDLTWTLILVTCRKPSQ